MLKMILMSCILCLALSIPTSYGGGARSGRSVPSKKGGAPTNVPQGSSGRYDFIDIVRNQDCEECWNNLTMMKQYTDKYWALQCATDKEYSCLFPRCNWEHEYVRCKLIGRLK